MNIEEIREYCLSLPCTSEDMPFEPNGIAFRVQNKIFAYLNLDSQDYFCLKCDPQYALTLREEHTEISGAWHWNKKYWNQVSYHGSLHDDFIKHLVRHSYNEVVKKLPKRIVAENPEIANIKD